MVATQIFFIFTPILREIIQFWVIFQMGDSTTKQKATLVWNEVDYTKSRWYDEEVDWNSKNLQSIQRFPVICHFCHDLPQWNHESSLHGFGLKWGVVKKYVSHRNTLDLPFQPYPRTVTTRSIMILVGDPLNPELNLYLPLDVTGCGVRSKYLLIATLVFSLGPNSLKDPRGHLLHPSSS